MIHTSAWQNGYISKPWVQHEAKSEKHTLSRQFYPATQTFIQQAQQGDQIS